MTQLTTNNMKITTHRSFIRVLDSSIGSEEIDLGRYEVGCYTKVEWTRRLQAGGYNNQEVELLLVALSNFAEFFFIA